MEAKQMGIRRVGHIKFKTEGKPKLNFMADIY